MGLWQPSDEIMKLMLINVVLRIKHRSLILIISVVTVRISHSLPVLSFLWTCFYSSSSSLYPSFVPLLFPLQLWIFISCPTFPYDVSWYSSVHWCIILHCPLKPSISVLLAWLSQPFRPRLCTVHTECRWYPRTSCYLAGTTWGTSPICPFCPHCPYTHTSLGICSLSILSAASVSGLTNNCIFVLSNRFALG